MLSEPIRRAREEKAGRRGLCEELGQLFGVSKEPLAATSEGSLCTGPSFTCCHTSGGAAASGGRCWLRALWFLQVTKLRLREFQLTTQGHTAVEVVREPGQSHSRARSLVSRRWPLVAAFSSTLLTSLCSRLGRTLSALRMELLGEKFGFPSGPPASCSPFGVSPPPALQPVDPLTLSLPWPGHSCLCLVPWPLGRHVEEQRRVPGWGNPAAGHSARDRVLPLRIGVRG